MRLKEGLLWLALSLVAWAIVLVPLVLLLVGCGGSAEPSADDKQTIDPPACAASGPCTGEAA